MANMRVLPVGFARTQRMTCRIAGDGEEMDGSLGPGYALGSTGPSSPFVSPESDQLCQRTNQERPFYGTCAKKLQSTTRRNPTAHHHIEVRPSRRAPIAPFHNLEGICGLSD